MFLKVAENMMADYIQSIQIAPDGVVTEIYPEAGNEDGKIDLIHDKERYLTDRRFNMISRAKKYVAVLPVFVCVCMNTHLAKPLDIEKMKNTIKDICP